MPDDHEQPDVSFKLFNISLSVDAEQDMEVDLDEEPVLPTTFLEADSGNDSDEYMPVPRKATPPPVTPVRSMKRTRITFAEDPVVRPKKKQAVVRIAADSDSDSDSE